MESLADIFRMPVRKGIIGSIHVPLCYGYGDAIACRIEVVDFPFVKHRGHAWLNQLFQAQTIQIHIEYKCIRRMSLRTAKYLGYLPGLDMQRRSVGPMFRG